MTKRLVLLCAAVLLAAAGCRPQRDYRTVDGTMLGTRLHLVADAPATARELYAAAMRLDSAAKRSMSLFDDASLLNRLNRNETDSTDRHIRRNLLLADSIARLSGGAYDVTVGPLVKAWGFAGRRAEAAPDVDSLLRFVGYDKVRLEGTRLVKADPRVQIDLNSIAKGYTVDLLAELLEEAGAENYIADIGGEVRCRGLNRQGRPWRIGVETPFDGNQTDGAYIERRIALSEGAMATSGNYRRFYLDAEGRKIAHTIDPRTGYSRISRLLSATVVAPTCAEADALGTMFMALGDAGARSFAEAHPELPVYLIFAGEGEQYEEYLSPAMEKLIIKD